MICVSVISWFTPTHVGKTLYQAYSAGVKVVHPHSRGEDGIISWLIYVYAGSPPLTWGRLEHAPVFVFPPWFTPTHVGKTLQDRIEFSGVTVHPHSRGEDLIIPHQRPGSSGSPPLTWGRRAFARSFPSALWFTPTHVGKTDNKGGRWDVAVGSPPLTWGRHTIVFSPAVVVWFTPTHVGKTLPLSAVYKVFIN